MQGKLDQNNTINTFDLLPMKINNMGKMWTIVILVTWHKTMEEWGKEERGK